MGSHRENPATLRHSPPPSIICRMAAASLLMLGLALSADAAMSRGFNRLLEAVVRIDVREIEFTEGTKRITGGGGSGGVTPPHRPGLAQSPVVSPPAGGVFFPPPPPPRA